MQYFVIRLPRDEIFNDIRKELLKGKLRVAWGADGMDLRNGLDSFIQGWKKKFLDADDLRCVERRYRILSVLREIKKDDIIIVPNCSIRQAEYGRYFTLAECIEEYSFEPMPKYNDFGHVIGVKLLNSFDYSSENKEQNEISNILTKIHIFRRAVTQIRSEDTIRCIENLIKPLPPPESNLDSMKTKMLSMQAEYLDGLLKVLQSLPPDAPSREDFSRKVLEALRMFLPDALKKLVKDLFVNNGYRLLGEESGGFVFELFSERELMHDIYKVDEPQKIFVFVKTFGDSYEKAFAVFEQVENNHMRILIDLTEQVDDTTAAKANSAGILLVNGLNFANILARHKVAKS